MSMIQFLAGLAEGGLEGRRMALDEEDRKRRNARQDEDAAFVREQRARERAQWQEDDRVKAELRQAGQPVAPVSGEVYQPSVDDEGNAMPANPTTGTLRVGDQTFTDPAAAGAAAEKANTMSAVARRQSDVLKKAGRVKEAADHAAAAQQLEKEGHLQFIDTNLPRLPSVEAIKAGQTDFPLEGIDMFNAAGGGQIPPGARGRAKVTTLPNGQEVNDFEVVDATGKPIAPSARQFEYFYGQTRADRQRNDATMAGQAETKRHATRMEQIAQQNADSEKAYREGIVSTKDKAAGAKAANAVERMSEIDRLNFNNINKQRDGIEQAITKAQAEGTWSEESPNAKALRGRLATLGLQAGMLLQRYSADDAPDPLGLRGAAPAPAQPSTRPMTKMEMVMADMKKTGVTNANVQLDGNPTMSIGQPGAPAAAPASAAATPRAPQAEQPMPHEAAGAVLDAARERTAVARQALSKFGQRQRSENPKAYEAAAAELRAAQAAEADADAAYQKVIPTMSAAFRTPKP